VGLIKIDVEGHEIDVLKGAKNSLKTGKVDAVVIEGTFTPNQIKSGDFFEVNDFMVSCGFQVQGVYDLDYSHIYSKGVFKLGNFLYIKSSNPYLGN
jgi:hypothetical protein